ncbi:membrane protein insertion efficiency factor YidD [Clostridium sediminicola]|uniref:membrane protein insertion efficiency factor YidD n=1 Tax=Clostridium sediminicola TaxID=3114879 RepID=UPI003D167EAC
MKKIIIYFIKIYRKYISPLKAPSCRFYPTCSQYAIQAIEKYGLLRGGFMSIKRIARCNPYSRGGYDPVK